MAKVNINIQGSGNELDDDEIAFGGNTERMNLGDKSMDGQSSDKVPFSIYDMLNMRYMSEIKADEFQQEVIIHNRLRKIQRWYKAHYQKRVRAAKLIE